MKMKRRTSKGGGGGGEVANKKRKQAPPPPRSPPPPMGKCRYPDAGGNESPGHGDLGSARADPYSYY